MNGSTSATYLRATRTIWTLELGDRLAPRIRLKISPSNAHASRGKPATWEDAGASSARLGVHRKTLIRWARAGLVVGKRPNPNGKWLFATDIQIPRTADLIDGDRAFFSNGGGGGGGGSVPDDGHPGGPHAAAACGGGGGGVKAIYARVSTRKQLDDLDAQIAKLKAKYPDHVVFSDCASGLNFKRKGLLSLLQLAFAGRLQLVRVAHRDHQLRISIVMADLLLM